MLLRFERFDSVETSRISINPQEVASVDETFRRQAYGGNCEVSVITLKDGSKTCVYGHVADSISEKMKDA